MIRYSEKVVQILSNIQKKSNAFKPLNGRTFSVPSQRSKTINENEVKRFDDWSKNWWDINGPARGLHMYNNLRVPFTRDELINTRYMDRNRYIGDFNGSNTVGDLKLQPWPLKGFTIADVGCGAGVFSESLAKLGANVTGIDASADVIAVARDHAALDPSITSKGNLKYEIETVDDHARRNAGRYDAVVCSEVIEHVDEKEFFVEQCVKLVKRGGSLIFTTPNRTLASWASVILWTENVVKQIPKGTHHYSMFITPKELENMFEKNGCQLRTLQGTCAKPNLQEFFYVNTLQFCYLMHVIKK